MPALDARAAGLQGDRAGRLDDAERLLAAGLGDPLARGAAGQVLVGAEVHRGAGLLVLVDAGVEGDDRDVRAAFGRLHRATSARPGWPASWRCRRPWSPPRSGSAWPAWLGSGSLRVLQVDAVVLGGLVRARLDLVPERVTRSLVGDHRDRVAGVVAGAAAAAGGRLGGLRCTTATTGGQSQGGGDRSRGQGQALTRTSEGGALAEADRESSDDSFRWFPGGARTLGGCA